MQDANTVLFLVSSVLFLASMILGIVFCFKLDADILWLVSAVLFVFGTFLYNDGTTPVFIALLISAILLVIFSSRGRVIVHVAVIFALLAAIFSTVISSLWSIAVFIFGAYTLIENTLSRRHVVARQPDGESLQA